MNVQITLVTEMICDKRYNCFSSGLSGGELSLDNIDETKASEPKAKESEPEDDQIKKTGDFKLTVNLRKVDLTLSRKNIKIVRAVIEGKYCFGKVYLDERSSYYSSLIHQNVGCPPVKVKIA